MVKPVVFALYGIGGGLGFASPASLCASSSFARCSACISCCDNGPPRPRVSGVIWPGRAAPP